MTFPFRAFVRCFQPNLMPLSLSPSQSLKFYVQQLGLEPSPVAKGQ